jgi:RHS repeat-associated protein
VLGLAFAFTTDPVLKSYAEDPANATTPKVGHITELRTAVNAVRALAGRAPATWTNPNLHAGVSPISVNDVRDLRTKLNEALSDLGIPLPTYTDASLVGFSENAQTATPIKVVHIRQLRDYVRSGVGGSGGGSVNSSLQIHWLITDQLGTPRMIVDQSGTLASVERHDYLPFGEELSGTAIGRTSALGYSANDNVRQQFNQKERDNETGLDFFEARYFSSTQGRFTSPDPYNPVVDSQEEDDLEEYLGQPQNWNRYTFVWNNPLRFVDPNGEKVYVVVYTTGNDVDNGGDAELRRAAETKAQAIQNSKGFNPKKDKVLLRGVQTKNDFAKVINEANGLNKQFGKVEQIALYAHSGPESGPIFHEASPENHNQTQFTQRELSNLKVNWSGTATARIYGCNTGVNFAQNFANAQGVPTFGYQGYAYFSNSATQMIPDEGGRRPLYMIQADYGRASGLAGMLRYQAGYGRVFPMVRRNPPPKQRPRR